MFSCKVVVTQWPVASGQWQRLCTNSNGLPDKKTTTAQLFSSFLFFLKGGGGGGGGRVVSSSCEQQASLTHTHARSSSQQAGRQAPDCVCVCIVGEGRDSSAVTRPTDTKADKHENIRLIDSSPDVHPRRTFNIVKSLSKKKKKRKKKE